MATFRAVFKNFPSSRETFSAISSIVAFSTIECPLKSRAQITSDHVKNQRADVYTSTKKISSYAENFRLDEALKVFDEMPVRDVVVWNAMIKGCIGCGNLPAGLKLFDEMPERNVVSWTTMIGGLFKCGMVEEAKGLFWKMPGRDTAAWNAVVHGLFTNGRVDEAIKLFEAVPNKNIISWTSMIGGLDQHGRSDDALLIFWEMVRAGLKPTSRTYSCAITSCASVGNLCLGSQVHGHVLKLAYVFDTYVTSSLISFYANCKRSEECFKVFDEKLHENVVVWTALLTGYGANGNHEDALEVFRDMVRLKIVPNQSSFTSALNSSREIEMVDWGKGIHGVAIKLGLEKDPFVGNSLVVLYTKCGSITDGVLAFQEIECKNIVSWNSIIVGCAQHGCGKWALEFFAQMAKEGYFPDEITFTGLLNSCSHSRMLQKGKGFFECLSRQGTLETKLEHYACMVDILCRNGKLVEAEDLIKKMPMEANLSIWLTLLSGCRANLNVEIAESASEKAFLIDPQCSAAYVLLSNIYAFSGRWADVAKTRRDMKRAGALKQPGRSWVVIRGKRHSFVSCDESHPLSVKIYEKLDWLGEKLKEYGYVSDQRFALHDVEEEHKGVLLSYHSERLAICFWLVSGAEGGTITVMKNLRTCEDCHSAIKLVAKIVEREIVVRDSSRFHHFRDGFCSCGDHW